MKEHIKTDWIIIDKGVACVFNGVTLKKYSFVQIELTNNSTSVIGLRHGADTSSAAVWLDTYSNDSSFEWTIVEIGINCPLIKQTNSIYCGFATLLQIMYGAGTADCLTNSNRLHDQMVVLTNNSHAGSAPMYQETIEGYLNNQDRFTDGSFDNYSYQYDRTVGRGLAAFYNDTNTNTIQAFIETITNSFDTGFSPFFLTISAGAPYKYGSTGAHYIAIIGYDPISECAIIENSHYIDTIYGIYAVPINYLYNNIEILYWCSERHVTG